MSIPDRDANSNDPTSQPYPDEATAADLFQISAWLTWRLTDPDLSDDLRLLIELEAGEARARGQLFQAMEDMPGDSLEAKMKVPQQRATLRALTLRWLRYERLLIDATTESLDHASATNGH
jgi:hypothetical protein